MQKAVDFQYYADRARLTNNKTQARISYLRAIKDNPPEEGINHEFAKFLRDAKYYKEAEFRYRKTSIMMPSSTSVYNEWGILLDRQGKLEGQEELFRKTLELNSSSVTGLCNLGAVLTEKYKYEEAIVVFEKALNYNPDHALTLNNLASIYLIIGKYDKTIEKLQKALEINGDHLLASINLGFVNSCLKKDDEAKKNLQKALDLLRDDSDKKEMILRGCKRLLNQVKENSLRVEIDQERRNHNERFINAIEGFLSLLISDKEGDLCSQK